MSKYLTPGQTAQQMGCTLDWIYRELRAGRFAGANKVGKQWRIPRSAVQSRLKARAEALGNSDQAQ